MRRFLTLNSLIIVLLSASCSNPYKALERQKNKESALRFKPDFDKVIYRAIVDGGFLFKKYHISGLLIIKQLENGTKRAVLQNEMGPVLFDFEWQSNGVFEVKEIMPDLNKEAVIKTLRKDFEILMMIGLDRGTEINYKQSRGKELYNRFSIAGGYVYYISNGQELVRIENANNRKTVVTVNVDNFEKGTRVPKAVLIEHHKANFTISLNKIESDVNE